jgi:anti-anti-sigma factor
MLAARTRALLAAIRQRLEGVNKTRTNDAHCPCLSADRAGEGISADERRHVGSRGMLVAEEWSTVLRCVTDARAVEDEVVVAARDELERTAPMKLNHRICPTGEAVVDLGGDLDMLSADVAVNYVTDVIDRHRGPVTVNLSALAFCDARGLAALVRMAGYAEQKGCSFRLASPSPRLIKIMLITRLDRSFLTSQASALAPGEFVRQVGPLQHGRIDC